MNRFAFMALFLLGCSSTNIHYTPETISEVYISKKLTSTGFTSVGAHAHGKQMKSEEFYLLNEAEKTCLISAINAADRKRYRQGKLGKGIVVCKLRISSTDKLEVGTIAGYSEKCLSITNIDAGVHYLVPIQSEECQTLLKFLRQFYGEEDFGECKVKMK